MNRKIFKIKNPFPKISEMDFFLFIPQKNIKPSLFYKKSIDNRSVTDKKALSKQINKAQTKTNLNIN